MEYVFSYFEETASAIITLIIKIKAHTMQIYVTVRFDILKLVFSFKIISPVKSI